LQDNKKKNRTVRKGKSINPVGVGGHNRKKNQRFIYFLIDESI